MFNYIKKSLCILFVVAIAVSGFVTVNAADGFTTNMTGWKGLDSNWTLTEEGYKDGPEQGVNDFAVSDVTVDGNQDFTYTVRVNKQGGYGTGIAFGIKNATNQGTALQNFVYFMADPGSVYYQVFKDGVGQGVNGRQLTEAEKAMTDLTFTMKYDADSATIALYFNGEYIKYLVNAKDVVAGNLGVFAHDASIYVTAANYESKCESFVTNLPGWKGLDSNWYLSAVGYKDGGEQGIHDLAVSGYEIDGTTNFTYTATVTKDGGWAAGLVLGVKDISSRDAALKNFVCFAVDPGNAYYQVFVDGNLVTTPLRALTDAEKALSTYTLKVVYDAATGKTAFYLNDVIVAESDNPEYIKGYIGLYAHDASVLATQAVLEVEGVAAFESNLTGWRGLESSWANYIDGFHDGAEKTVEDIAVSEGIADTTKNFTYTVTFKKFGGYGAGLILGVKDTSSRNAALANYVYFIADPGNAYYKIHENGQAGSPIARQLTDEEKALTEMTLKVVYDAKTQNAKFYLNDSLVSELNDAKDILSGNLGVISHDANIAVLSSNYAESTPEPDPTEKPADPTETPDNPQNPESGDGISFMIPVVIAMLGMVAISIITNIKKKSTQN